MKHLWLGTIVASIALVTLCGCPPNIVQDEVTGDLSVVQLTNINIDKSVSTSGVEIQLKVKLGMYCKDTFIDLPDSDLIRVDAVVWYGNSGMIIPGLNFVPEQPMSYPIPNSFAAGVSEIHITLLGYHRYLPNKSPYAVSGGYWCYLPKIDALLNNELLPEARDSSNNPLGYFSIPVAQLNASGTPIVIDLQNNNTQYVIKGSTYVDPGATAADAVDGDISNKIVTTGSVNTAVAGTYHIYYDVVNHYGLAAYTVVRTIVVAEKPTASYAYFTYASRYPNGNIALSINLNAMFLETIFPNLTSASQIDKISVLRYYDDVTTAPWSTFEDVDFVGDRDLYINMSPGRTKKVRFNIVAVDYSGKIYYANPDYFKVYYNRKLIAKNADGTWTFTVI